MKLINIGFGNLVSASRLIAIVSPESAPIERIVQDVRERGEFDRRDLCSAAARARSSSWTAAM